MTAPPAASRHCDRAALDAARRLFESSAASTAEIARSVGLSATSVARYARGEGWLRPPAGGAALSPARRLTQRLWTALEHRIALVEKDPGATPARDFVALAHALRDLAAFAATRAEKDADEESQIREQVGADGEDGEAEAVRAELLARLERILPG